jgi:hypothetical protein
MDRSLLHGNRASLGGGVLLNEFTSTSLIHNVTLSGNTATGLSTGGGLFNNSILTLANVTVTRNAAVTGGGVFNGGTVQVFNSIIAQNRGTAGAATGPDAFGTFTSLGHNLIGSTDGSSGWNPSVGDLLGNASAPLDARLGPLADNGGPTLTHALLPGSPAIDTCDPLRDAVPLTDQRGVVRPRDGDGNGSPLGDIGAFEK